MAETIRLTVGKGINNRNRIDSIPEGYCADAVNVDFDTAGKAQLRPGQTLVYSGNCHSLWNRYFVEDGVLKYLNEAYTATELHSGLSDNPMSYCSIAGRVYYSNGVDTGSIVNGQHRSWGVPRPPHQPTCSVRSGGGMAAGTYQIAITWLRDGEESGTVVSTALSIGEGEGILLSGFPTPPADIDQVAVYCSSVNGTELYLYKEVASNIVEMFVSKHISTIPLTTQFAKPFAACEIIESHYGRIYGALGSLVYYTDAQNYGLQHPNQYWAFPDTVRGLVSTPGALYVGTCSAIYRITGIDGDGPAQRTQVKNYGMTRLLNTPYDTKQNIGYITSTQGYCLVSSEGVTEIAQDQFVMDEYGESLMSVVEQDRHRKLIGIHLNKIKDNPLKRTN